MMMMTMMLMMMMHAAGGVVASKNIFPIRTGPVPEMCFAREKHDPSQQNKMVRL